METFQVELHHSGYFWDEEMKNYIGQLDTWDVDPDMWSYYEVLGKLKDMGFVQLITIWYDINGFKKLLENDQGTKEMHKWAQTNGSVHLYTLHPICEPSENEIAAGPQLNEPDPHNTLLIENTPLAQNTLEAQNTPVAQNTSKKKSNKGRPKRRKGKEPVNETNTDGQRDQNETVHVEDEDEDAYNTDGSPKERFNDSDDEVGEYDGFEEPTEVNDVVQEPVVAQIDAVEEPAVAQQQPTEQGTKNLIYV